MGQSQAKIGDEVDHYHISKRMGGTEEDPVYIFWWPMAGFGENCTSLSMAKREYTKLCENGDKHRLLKVRVKVHEQGMEQLSQEILEQN